MVFVHDGARPFFSCKMVEGMLALMNMGVPSVIPNVCATESIRLQMAEDEPATVFDRRKVYTVQTPAGV